MPQGKAWRPHDPEAEGARNQFSDCPAQATAAPDNSCSPLVVVASAMGSSRRLCSVAAGSRPWRSPPTRLPTGPALQVAAALTTFAVPARGLLPGLHRERAWPKLARNRTQRAAKQRFVPSILDYLVDAVDDSWHVPEKLQEEGPEHLQTRSLLEQNSQKR